jgi:methylated-DNA-[protein]-cysteine S-methyltransferase
MGATPLYYDVEGWGVGELWLDGETVVWHELPSPRLRTQVTSCHLELVERLRAYFGGEDVSFGDVPVDLEYESPFYERCSQALRAVPRGEVVTYGELAALAGAPRAARAAGTFCARNRVPIFVPCHRVVSAGGLGQYPTLGVDYKRRLLELELSSDRVVQLTRSRGRMGERSLRRNYDA